MSHHLDGLAMKEGGDTQIHTPPTDGNLPAIESDRENGLRPQETISPSLLQRVIRILTWCPPRCRWDPENPPKFSMTLNVMFGFAGAFTVANLYYNHPILNILADDFGVEYEQVSQIPTVMQAGYATGLLFLCPLGDALPRRPFTLGLVFFTATMW